MSRIHKCIPDARLIHKCNTAKCTMHMNDDDDDDDQCGIKCSFWSMFYQLCQRRIENQTNACDHTRYNSKIEINDLLFAVAFDRFFFRLDVANIAANCLR